MSQSASTSVHCTPGRQHMKILLQGDVTDESIIELINGIEYGISYYQYNHFILEISSPGGRIDALGYFIDKIKKIRGDRPEFILETRAAIQSCSAAAIMLSLGTLGYRHAGNNSKLVYHQTRVLMQNHVTTGSVLEQLSSRLKQTDDSMLIELCSHLYSPVIDKEAFTILRIILCDLPSYCDPKRAELLKKLRSKGIDGLLSKLQAAGDMDEELFQELHEQSLRCLKSLEKSLTKKYSDLSKADSPNPQWHLRSNLGWLMGRMAIYRSIFAEDRPLMPVEARKLQLIDHV